MTMILALDPGSTRSGWVVTRDGTPFTWHTVAGTRLVAAGVAANDDILDALRNGRLPEVGLLARVPTVVIEWMQTRQGAPIGAETFETLWWAGRFAEAVVAGGGEVFRLERAKVMQHLCGGPRRKDEPSADSLIGQALIDRFGGIGGKAVAVGLKASPGPIYGITSDAKQALAVAVTFTDDPGLAHP